MSSGDQSPLTEIPTSTLEPNSSAEQPKETLEDLMRCLHHQIQDSDWLQKNTAEKWLMENPKAAQSLQELFPNKIIVPPNTPVSTPEGSEAERLSEFEEAKH